MANPTLSQIKVGQTTYDICDITARDALEVTQSNITIDEGTTQIASSALRKMGHMVQLTMNGVTLAKTLKQ